MAGQDIGNFAYILPVINSAKTGDRFFVLNYIPAPAIPEPAHKKAGDRSNQTRCPMNWMRVSIQCYSGNDVTKKSQSENSKIDDQRPLFFRFGLLTFISHSGSLSGGVHRRAALSAVGPASLKSGSAM
jgi:hypothetical protein